MLLSMVAVMAAPSSASYTIRDLGVAQSSGTSGATAINASGQAAGFETVGGAYVAAMSGGGNLQALSFQASATSSYATSINASGSVGGYFTDPSGVDHGFYTTKAGMVVLKPMVAGKSAEISGINGNSQVVGTGVTSSGTVQAFTAGADGTQHFINPLIPGGTSHGQAINDFGNVVGYAQTASGLMHAFVTDPDGHAVDLSTRNSSGVFSFNTRATAIANTLNGDVVGYGDVGSSDNAFFASSKGGALVDLGTLDGALSSRAYGVNSDSQVVGEFGSGFGLGGSSAFIWDPTSGMVDLNTLLSKSDREIWSLAVATGINDSGQISGEGFEDGVLHGFVITPTSGSNSDPSVAPTPPTLVLSALGFGIAASWARFRRGRTGDRGAV